MHVPHFVVELAPGHHLPRLEHEMFEQPQLPRRQLDLLTLLSYASRQPIELQVSHYKLITHKLRIPAAQEAAHSRPKLLVGHRLDDVLIGARIETTNDCIGPAHSGVEKDWRAFPFCPQLLNYLESMPVTEVCVEDNSVVVVDERQQPRLLPGGGDIESISVIRQDTLDQSRDRSVVLRDQDANCVTPVTGARGSTSIP